MSLFSERTRTPHVSGVLNSQLSQSADHDHDSWRVHRSPPPPQRSPHEKENPLFDFPHEKLPQPWHENISGFSRIFETKNESQISPTVSADEHKKVVDELETFRKENHDLHQEKRQNIFDKYGYTNDINSLTAQNAKLTAKNHEVHTELAKLKHHLSQLKGLFYNCNGDVRSLISRLNDLKNNPTTIEKQEAQKLIEKHRLDLTLNYFPFSDYFLEHISKNTAIANPTPAIPKEVPVKTIPIKKKSRWSLT